MEILLAKKSYERVRDRLDALGIDLHVICVDADGGYTRDGKPIQPEDAEPEAFWLSIDFLDAGQFNAAFDMALRPGTVKWMQTLNAGLDRGRYKEVVESGVRLCNSSAQSVAISEFVMAHVLNAFQPIDAQYAAQTSRDWVITHFPEISRSSWLIIGFGPIGQAVARRARAFDAHISVIRRGDDSMGLADRMGHMEDLPELLPDADVILLACSLNDETRGFANAEFFRHVKQDAVLVNIARGGLVDDEALLACLDEGRMRLAVLDTFSPEPLDPESRYWDHPRVRVTAHTSWAGNGTIPRGDDLFVENLARYARGEPLDMEVNPETVFGASKYRTEPRSSA